MPKPQRQPDEAPSLRYLRAAVDLALAQDSTRPGLPLVAAGVQLAEVAATMGRSRTSIYKLWETRQQFLADLALYLVVNHDYSAPSELMPWRDPALSTLPSDLTPGAFHETSRQVLNLLQDQVVRDPWIIVRAVTVGYGDPGAVAPLRREAEEGRLEDLSTILELGLGAVGFPLPGDLADDLAIGLWCLADGFATLVRKVPSLADQTIEVDDEMGRGPQPWKLFAYFARCLLSDAIEQSLARSPLAGAAADADAAEPAEARPTPPGSSLAADAVQRWTAEQLEVLTVGAAMFVARLDDPQGDVRAVDGLTHLTVAGVARQAKVSRRTIYDLWSSSESLRVDVLRGLLHAEVTYYATRLGLVAAGARTDVALAATSRLLRLPDPTRITPADAINTFLLDSSNPKVAAILEGGVERLIQAVSLQVERLWWPASTESPASVDPRVASVALISLTSGANRLMRTNPDALARGDAHHLERVLPSVFRAIMEHRAASAATSAGADVPSADVDPADRRRPKPAHR